MRAKLIRELPHASGEGMIPAGTVIETDRAFRLVQMGVAEPDDDECRQRAGMTPERFAAAQVAYDRVSRGIHPDDYEAFDAGIMIGYRGDGSWIPGPNAELCNFEEVTADELVDEADQVAAA